MIRVLVDNAVWDWANILDPVTISVSSELKDQPTETMSGYMRKQPLLGSEKWKQEEIDWLPTLAKLSQSDEIALYTYKELQYESWFRGGRPRVGNIFSGCSVSFVEPAIERSCFVAQDLLKHAKAEEKMSFCQKLLDWADTRQTIFEQSRHTFPILTQQSLNDLKRYKEICAGLSHEQRQDAFHLWTAEVNGMDYFLTVDKKFMNAMTKSKPKQFQLKSQPVLPSGLVSALGITKQNPYRYLSDDFISYDGTAIRVRDIKTPKRTHALFNLRHNLMLWLKAKLTSNKK